MSNAFLNALAQLSRADAVRSVKKNTLARLEAPEREVRVSIPVTLDNGELKMFEGYRVGYSSARGPYKGGIRYHQDTDINEVKALAFWMAIKTAVANIPMGGGKGGITVEPGKLSKGELERLSRGFVRALLPILGPKVDVPAPDVNTTPEIMTWMNDEYAKLSGDKSGATFTGKPLGQGGSEGRGEATGLGGFYVFDALKELANIPSGATIAIQGMGNVGGNAAKIFHEHGYKVVALSDSRGAIFTPAGLDPTAVEEYKKKAGKLEGFPGAKAITNAELLELSVEVLIPAALENQITKENAANIKAKMVLELANGPTTPEADDILLSRGIVVVPDVLANSGGVIVSTFEWEQNLKGEHWTKEVVLGKLKDILVRESKNVAATANKLKTDLRRAAFLIAIERIEEKFPR